MFHVLLQEKLQIIFSIRIAQKLCKPASRAREEVHWQAKVAPSENHGRKYNCLSLLAILQTTKRHFHNNGQAHTLILNLPFTGKCQRRFDPSNGPANFLPMQRRRHVNVFRIKVNKSFLSSCHGKFAENTLENMNATYSRPDTCSDVGYLISTSRW